MFHLSSEPMMIVKLSHNLVTKFQQIHLACSRLWIYYKIERGYVGSRAFLIKYS